MRKYTLEDFKNFEKDDNGRTICPSGDYRGMKQFPNQCSFGEWCSFGEGCSFGKDCKVGEGCSFGEWCKVENDKELKRFLKFEGFGSERRCTYFFLLTDNTIYVRCGCFSGYIDEFRSKVKETHGDSLYAQGYFKAADLAQWYFEEENKSET